MKQLLHQPPEKIADLLRQFPDDEQLEYLKMFEGIALMDPSKADLAIGALCAMIEFVTNETMVMDCLRSLMMKGSSITDALVNLSGKIENPDMTVSLCYLLACFHANEGYVRKLMTDMIMGDEHSSFTKARLIFKLNNNYSAVSMRMTTNPTNILLEDELQILFIKDKRNSIVDVARMISGYIDKKPIITKNFRKLSAMIADRIENKSASEDAIQVNERLRDAYATILQNHLAESLWMCERIKDILNDTSSNKAERSTAADCLLTKGVTPEYRIFGQTAIIKMGQEGEDVDAPLPRDGQTCTYSVYNDSQNAHNVTIRASALGNVKKLIDLMNAHTDWIISSRRAFAGILARIKSKTSGSDQERALRVIEIVRTGIYSISGLPEGITLSMILHYVWSYIKKCPDVKDSVEDLKARLIQEIVSADDTCLTGVEERIINSLSGFGGFELQMDYETAMKYLITREIQMAIQSIEDDDVQDQVMEGMIPEAGEARDMYKEFARSQRSSIYTVCKASSCYFNDDNRDKDYFSRLFDSAFNKFLL